MLRSAAGVIDTHAHFFNGSDVPVKGFVAECIGHNAPDWLRPLIKEIALIAEALAGMAPTARQELDSLNALSNTAQGLSAEDVSRTVDSFFDRERQVAAQRVVEVVNGTGFERRYREMVGTGTGLQGQTEISAGEVLSVAGEARSKTGIRSGVQSLDEKRASAAKAKLEFLFYMLSLRATNVRTYIEAFVADGDQYGVEMVLGSLVDFDYWLDCPPMSAHEDQIQLHEHLANLHGGFLRPVVPYNPWTDLEQNGKARTRVQDAWKTGVFVGAKIYPPTGFLPAANATTTINSNKRHPNRRDLDGALSKFFEMCADEGIPVLAHAARSNGRDDAHDEFSSPAAWDAFLDAIASKTRTPIISLGHLGGDDPGNTWTSRFAATMQEHAQVQVYGDLGFWDHLMSADSATSTQARDRLKAVLGLRLSDSETVADRVMFGSDWLMLSQVSGWQAYPRHVRDALEAITNAEDVAKIMAGNAKKCFAKIAAPLSPS